MAAAYGNLPLAFEPNVGQSSARVDYLARGSGYSIALTARQADLLLQPSASSSGDQIALTLVGANGATPQAQDKLPGVANYLVGDDPSQWRTNVSTYAKVAYDGVYPGIDLIYHGAGQQFEYDFAVYPGGSTGAIRVQVAGAMSMSLDAQGDLVLHTGAGDALEKAPVAYQVANGVQQGVAARYVILNSNQFGFAVGPYDASLPLVIDPTLDYSTYFGGSGDDTATAVAVDAGGSAYFTGTTVSADLPTASPEQSRLAGTQNAFIAKLNPAGSALMYSTYLGGSGTDAGNAIAVDPSGDAYVSGTTTSSNFPIVNALQSTFPGGTDGFLVRLNPAGNQLQFSTYLGGHGGNGFTTPTGIAVDNQGHVYLSGRTTATDFPTTSGAFQTSFGDKNFYASSNGASSFSAPAVNLPNIPIQVEAVDPQTPSIIYAGGSGGEFQTDGNGLLKSSDSGVHWTALTNGLPAGFGPTEIVVDPSSPSTVYAGSSSQIFKTTDGGADWTAASSGLPGNLNLTALVIDPSNPAILHAAGNGSGVFKTTDGGVSWGLSGTGLPANAVLSLAIAASQPATLYAGLSSGGDAIAKTTDGGATWTPLSSITNTNVEALAVDPHQANTVYAMVNSLSASSIRKSTDGGGSFVNANNGLPTILQQGPLVIDPVNSSTLYYISPSALGINPAALQNLFVLFKTSNGGASWSPVPGLNGKGVTAVAVDPTNDTHVYLGLSSGFDLFITKLNAPATGAPSLAFSTYLHGSGDESSGGFNDAGNNLAIDSAGNVFVTGNTSSSDFPTSAGVAQTALRGVVNAFVTELNAAGSGLVYSTYLGGSNEADGVGIAVDSGDRAVVTGFTLATDFPTLNALQPHNPTAASPSGNAAGFVTKLNPSGQLIYSTYLGGSANNGPQAVAVDAAGNAYVVGSTTSSDFPVVNPFQGTLNGLESAFVTKITPSGNAFVYSSYFGGSNFETGSAIALDSAGNAYVVGTTASTDFPVANPLQGSNHGGSIGQDAFIIKIIPWAGADVTVGADDKERVLWQGAGGTGDVGIVTGSNRFTAGPVYAPYGNWLAKSAATGGDGDIRILWSNPDGHTSVWVVGANGAFQQAVVFGPQAGWTAVGITVGSDGVTRVLWSNVNGAAAVWQLNNSLALTSATVYGPFSGWSVRSIAAASSDGFVRLLWRNVNGSSALWLLNPDGSFHSADVVGPISGWSVQDITDAPDNQTRLLWESSQGQIVIWAVTDAFGLTASPSFGPVSGWTAERLAAGSDGLIRVFWLNVDGSVAIWDLNPEDSFKSVSVFGAP
jgi:hypothetical protein